VRPLEGENTLALNGRVSAAISALIDEADTDWYAATRRAATEASPPSGGPDVAHWRRVWQSSAGPKTGTTRPKAWR
jgi:1-acyl-sn-glycerol-3-phosphate acyltransferase